MKLQELAEDIYSYDFEVDILAGIIFPARSIIVRLNNSDLLWYSPGPVNENLIDEIKDLGEIKHIIAPNLFHHIYFRSAQEKFPEAKAWIPRGLNQKKKKKPLENTHTYNSFEDLGLLDDFDGIVLAHHTFLRELCLVHKKTGVLILTDFCFNMDNQFKNFRTKLCFMASGTHKGLKQSKLIKKTCKYPTEFLNDCNSLFKLSEEAKGLIMAHGNVLDEEGFKQEWPKLIKQVRKMYS